jgi:hypothetical protein
MVVSHALDNRHVGIYSGVGDGTEPFRGPDDQIPMHPAAQYKYYLPLVDPLVPGVIYTVSHPTYGDHDIHFQAETVRCESLKVNQIGAASPSSFAVFGVWLGTLSAIHSTGGTYPTTFRIVQADSTDPTVGAALPLNVVASGPMALCVKMNPPLYWQVLY